MSALTLEHVCKSYGETEAVRDVSFDCQEGEFFTLFGPSGAGKTTLLELIAGIKGGYSGNILIKGRPLEGMAIQDRNVAMSFEDYALYPHLNAGENIAFPLRSPRAAKIGDTEIWKKVQCIADELDIGHLLDRNPVQLSGGQRQRVSLARALVREADIYLLDEPIAHLDAKLRTIARANLKAMAQNLGATILYVTHDFREALGLSDRLLILNGGRVLQINDPRTIYHTPATDYVGRLVGDPIMNLVDGKIVKTAKGLTFETRALEERALKDRTVSFALSGRLEAAAQQRFASGQTENVRLGVRPGGVIVQDKDPGNGTRLPVYTIEHRARHLLVYFQIGGVFFGGIADPHTQICLGQEVYVQIDAGRGYLFDATFDLATPVVQGGGS